MQVNSLPNQGGHDVNIIARYSDRYQVYDLNLVREDLVQMHATFFIMGGFARHNYKFCRICSEDSRGCATIKANLQ